ncbi:MAG: MMPL family transporter [Deltaproteobacteria bacterium]|uniref:MMPL family transporter n=1 Tax=Candidatus Zymogenus saltonus TaxID=2844893 RepID=A0A9D8PLT5_9DELT|nr:MMPL family transporter [Candidatus Zymogenus saltonus]
MREALLKRLANIVYRYDLLVLLAAVLLTVVSTLGVLRLEMVSNVAYMLPEKNEAVSDYLTSLERMGTLDYLVIMVSGEEKNEITGFSDRFAEGIEDSGLINDVRYRVTEGDREFIFEKYLPNIFLYLDDEGFEKIADKLTDSAVDEAVEMDRKLLLTPASSGAAELVTADPLDFFSIIKEGLFSGEGGFRIDSASGYFLSIDGKHLLMLGRPVKPPQDIEFDKKLFSTLGKIENDIKEEYGFEGVKVQYTGGYAIAINDADTIKRDLMLTVFSSLIFVLLSFYFIFRRLSFLLFVGPSLGLGIYWTMGFAGFALGHLNMVTAAFGAILVGLGIDFSIHFYNRFIEEMAKGSGLKLSLDAAFSKTGLGILTGALTTSIAFFAMAFTQFKGLSELGIIGGVGIIMTLTSTFTVLPSLIVRQIKIRGEERISLTPVSNFGMEKLGSFLIRQKRLIIVSALLFSVVMGVFATRVGFETDINELRPKGNEAFAVQEEIWEIFSGSSSEVIITAKSREIEDALILSEKAVEVVGKYREIAKIEGPGQILPSVKRQWENIERTKGLNLKGVVSSFKEALNARQFKTEPFQPFIDSMESFADGDVEPITIGDIEGSVQGDMIKKYIQEGDEGWFVSIFAYPKSGVWKDNIDRGMVKALKKLSPEISVASISMVLMEMKRIIERDFINAITIALIGVFSVLLIQFKEFKGVFYSMISLGMGILWMLGFMGIFGISLNFANVVVAPMVIGIGIDDNIHIYHRYREGGKGEILAAVSFSGRAVIMTTVTTILGFGSLTFARYGGLSSIGFVAVVGVFFCLISALFVLPALVALGEGNEK